MSIQPGPEDIAPSRPRSVRDGSGIHRSPPMISRRHFLRSATAASLGFSGLHRLLGGPSPLLATALPDRFGPLRPDPDGILDLPDGFRYRVVSRAGDLMADGFRVPSRPDGMAAFPGPGGMTLLVRNHEVNTDASDDERAYGGEGDAALGPEALDPARVYDPGDGRPAAGGTTNLLVDTRGLSLVEQRLPLIGTVRNCAGGPTPWGTWITCEETVDRAGDGGLTRDHGYNFEVPAGMDDLPVRPVALRAMGRFNHEAVAVDPRSGVVFQTEDRGDSLLYRFVPERPGELSAGGRLQALVVVGHPSLDTRNWEERRVGTGERLPVTWIDLDDVDAPEDDLRHRGFAAGAARFARGEGMWHADDSVYFACTNGGRERKGQIWRYRPTAAEGREAPGEAAGTLELFVEPDDGTLVENADNLTMAPWGDLVVCEDGTGDDYLVGVTPAGELYKLARCAGSSSELAGACFSPDGSTFFVNIQEDGLTLAVQGPWSRG